MPLFDTLSSRINSNQLTIHHHPGIPTSAATYYTNDAPSSPTKYQENGHDTFSDFVTLVCQEAGQPAPGHAPRSPTKLVSYYSSPMYPPAPTPPMARHVKMDSSPPPLNMQIAGPGQPRQEARLSPSSPDPLPRTILYTYSGGGTIALPDSLSPANLSIVQPPRVSASVTKSPASSSPASIRWATSNGTFISDIDSSGIAYDLMTPMISGSGDHSGPGATLHLADGQYHSLTRVIVITVIIFRSVFQHSTGANGRHGGRGDEPEPGLG